MRSFLLLLLLLLGLSASTAPSPFAQFYHAAANGHVDEMKDLLKNFPGEIDPNAHFPETGLTPLIAALAHLPAVEYLLSLEGVSPNLRDKESHAPMIHVAEKGLVEAARRLLAHPQIDPNGMTKIGLTPFIYACMFDHADIVELLLKDERVDVTIEIDGGYTPFFSACQDDYVDVARVLMADPRIDVNKPDDEEGISPFFTSCVFNSAGVLELLLADERVNLNQPEFKKNHPFTAACTLDHKDLVVKLLEHPRVNLTRKANPKSTASHTECLKKLGLESHPLVLEREKADVEALPFHRACVEGNLESVKAALASKADLKLITEKTFLLNRSPAWYCASLGQVEVLREMMQSNEGVKADWTVLEAARAGLRAHEGQEEKAARYREVYEMLTTPHAGSASGTRPEKHEL